MICSGCAALADREKYLLARQAAGKGTNGSTVHLKHVVRQRTSQRCENPNGCTCQHRPIKDGYVNEDPA